MPRGDKSTYTSRQKRQATDIEKSYERKGVSKAESERRAWATVNKTSGGGLKKSTAKKPIAKKSPANKSAAKKSGKRTSASKATTRTRRDGDRQEQGLGAHRDGTGRALHAGSRRQPCGG